MRIKNLLPLLLAGSLMIACTPAKQAGNSFEWGQEVFNSHIVF